MDSQSFDYWMPQSNYITPPHQTTIFELPPELSKVPSLSGSPVRRKTCLLRYRTSNTPKVSSTYDHFPAPIHHNYYPQIADDSIQFGNYTIPMTPPEFGSDHDSPYCSPRPPTHAEPVFAHAEPVFAQVSQSGPTERTHTTSGVRSNSINDECFQLLTFA